MAPSLLRAEEQFTQCIVSFKEDAAWSEIQDYADELQSRGVFVVMDLPLVNGLALKVPAYIQANELSADPRILAVEFDQKMQLKSVAASTASGNSFIKKLEGELPGKERLPWGILKLFDQPYSNTLMLDEWNKHFLPSSISLAHQLLEATPIRIAVLDTGVFPSHQSFTGSFVGGLDIKNPIIDSKGKKKARKMTVSAVDDNGHGSHVAGTISAALDKSYQMGKHSSFELYSVKILDNQATGNLSDLVMALQWCVDKDIDIVNMSVAFRQDSPALRTAIEEAHKAGLTMVAAAGNKSNYDVSQVLKGIGAGDGGAGDGGAGDGGAGDGGAGDGGAGDGGAGDGGAGDGGAGDGAAGDGGAGDGGAGDGGAGTVVSEPLPFNATMYPARYDQVIAVASSTRGGFLADHSNFDETVDIMAPGVQVVSADITNGDMKNGFGYCNGTSMAAPHVTAAAALMLSIDPNLGPDEIREVLTQTADPSSKPHVGNINMNLALENALNGSMGQKISGYDRKELRKQYRQRLKAKMAAIGDTLWEDASNK
jgi:hypothetical protein